MNSDEGQVKLQKKKPEAYADIIIVLEAVFLAFWYLQVPSIYEYTSPHYTPNPFWFSNSPLFIAAGIALVGFVLGYFLPIEKGFLSHTALRLGCGIIIVLSVIYLKSKVVEIEKVVAVQRKVLQTHMDERKKIDGKIDEIKSGYERRIQGDKNRISDLEEKLAKASDPAEKEKLQKELEKLKAEMEQKIKDKDEDLAEANEISKKKDKEIAKAKQDIYDALSEESTANPGQSTDALLEAVVNRCAPEQPASDNSQTASSGEDGSRVSSSSGGTLFDAICDLAGEVAKKTMGALLNALGLGGLFSEVHTRDLESVAKMLETVIEGEVFDAEKFPAALQELAQKNLKDPFKVYLECAKMIEQLKTAGKITPEAAEQCVKEIMKNKQPFDEIFKNYPDLQNFSYLGTATLLEVKKILDPSLPEAPTEQDVRDFADKLRQKVLGAVDGSQSKACKIAYDISKIKLKDPKLLEIVKKYLGL